MNSKQLEAFINVAQSLNFSKAAQRMFVTQPTVSNLIKTLEQELGVALFERTVRNVHLTPAGETFYSDAKEIYTRIIMATDRAKQENKKFSAKISIGLSLNRFEKDFLPNFIKKFSQKNEETQLFFYKVKYKKGMQDLLERKIDILLFNTNEVIDNKTIKSITLYKDDFVLLIPNDTKLATQTTITIADLNTSTIIIPKRTDSHPELEELLKYIKQKNEYAHIIYCDDIQVAQLLVSCGLGVSIVPIFEVDNNKTITVIPLDITKITNINRKIPYGIAWNSFEKRKEITNFVKQFQQHFKKWSN
ncbi:LysR family transcriptional regulator [Ligilactobacillus sp. WILCCON 0076]|uniref:LysR family transcriptional regulator n=1 Tax=Ligilactobacillus ubinensis TaxID=2876789 RepID=A0A9X2JKZ5_9LACO|nr:LysR family transcriptional regulator [Ligilactobacillus ubinensis]MCP0886110.1 LysR family transcriptional regulator [Ligilactobacillus ubinensis]